MESRNSSRCLWIQTLTIPTSIHVFQSPLLFYQIFDKNLGNDENSLRALLQMWTLIRCNRILITDLSVTNMSRERPLVAKSTAQFSHLSQLISCMTQPGTVS